MCNGFTPDHLGGRFDPALRLSPSEGARGKGFTGSFETQGDS